MNYTKGEWEVRRYVAPVAGNQAAITCKEVWAGERRIASSINEANAHLIASAPDLYEALKRMMEWQIIEGDRIVKRSVPTHGTIYAAQKALDKAEKK